MRTSEAQQSSKLALVNSRGKRMRLQPEHQYISTYIVPVVAVEPRRINKAVENGKRTSLNKNYHNGPLDSRVFTGWRTRNQDPELPEQNMKIY
jgi:hypothetical protein